MFRWLVLTALLAVTLAEEQSPVQVAAADSQAEESAHQDKQYHDYGENLPGTGVLREVHPSGHKLPHQRIEEQNRIVYDRYSPNYYQPTWILDYRYLKTGGRDYTRGEGGQILILPKGIKAPHDENKKFGNYDELLEFLRLKELARNEELHRQRVSHNYENEHTEHHKNEDGDHWQRETAHEGNGHYKHHHTSWEKEAFGK